MRIIKYSVFIVLLILVVGRVHSEAMNTGFSTEPYSIEKLDSLLDKLKITVLTQEPGKQTIQCFDVNEDGLIAIGFRTTLFDNPKHKICVYSSEGLFQYGFSFESYGSFGVELDTDLLYIYLVRSNLAIAIDADGTIIEVKEIQDTINNTYYWHRRFWQSQKKLGNAEYVLRNDMGPLNVFAASYSQLVVTNEKGETRIIYDVNSEALIKMLIRIIAIMGFVCFVVVSIIWEFKKQKRKKLDGP